MVSTRYRPKDLKLARRHIVKAAHRVADQEMVIRKLLRKGRPSGSAYALLSRLYDDQRRKLDRLKLIEAMVEVEGQLCMDVPSNPGPSAPPFAIVHSSEISLPDRQPATPCSADVWRPYLV
ncbi:hypothetical protein ACCT14_15490 [Rhizobium brockwellii]|uniref:Uncharacterized protein n=1 Tax=Rhizobium leguminosarum TaxID=384 RepID=A0A3S3WVB6_RHILE|nr:hypothetical protein [Rhizobium leguminosarum]QND15098.1 hypothetical protein HB775_15275 [Rhizobium leguminosarum bv. trifolii]RWY84542.1 hypothetical protein EHI44_17860 [Rhizobium leguminosarum]TAU87856.1 hypothetical protein ELI41_04405 [Rhizobium leguminosarum]TAV47531.1 hypothetical protein ELI32_04500 [Rhizobium leguminosarum]TAV52386.1 hypothetical protein ELI29_04410 [Rhizobium leguminosarum]